MAFGDLVNAVKGGNVWYIMSRVGAADVSLHGTDDDGRTLLHFAVWENQLPMMRILILNGANLEARTGAGLTPLHIAARNGNLEATLLLVNWDAHINPLSNTRKSPAIFSFQNGHSEIFRILITAGAEAPTVELCKEIVCLDKSARGHAECLATLVANGAFDGRTMMTMLRTLESDCARIALSMIESIVLKDALISSKLKGCCVHSKGVQHV